MCDLNGHINNSLYLDIACDALPQEVVEAAPLSFTSIKYHREVPMGQSVQVFYAPSGNGWYLLGRRRSTQPLSAIWNSAGLSQNLYKNNYKEITKTIAKVLQKSYNMVTERARPFWIMKSFSSCFWNIGCPPSSSGCSPSQLPADTAQAIFRFVCKRVRLVSDGLLRPKIRKNRPTARESMTLGQFACFSAKDIYKVWRGRVCIPRGFVVKYIQSIPKPKT